MTLRRSSKYLLVLMAMALAAVMTAGPASASSRGHGYGPGWRGHHVVCHTYWVGGHWNWRHGYRYWVPAHRVRTCR
jgi:hypothetical protein